MRKDILILPCQCMFCKACLRERLLEEEVFTSSFEAVEGNEAVCVCPNHNWRVETRFLQGVLTPEELESCTLEVFRRQMKEVRRRKYLWPNVCVDCKRTISESIKNYQSSCHRHKICKECVE
eukprot:TRINITY_DN10288_c0_g1_i2.p1 TRINITY_DN10288_c0_g1~~TRINITY_DN10288_c0_g1_i2.p1  ORF type:complete len:122 (+),score=22.55 TRINITY_DN10288_c0_g1_i2:461-826(+)